MIIINPTMFICCDSSRVSCNPVLLLHEQQAVHTFFQGELTYICLAEFSLNMPAAQCAASTVQGISHGEEARVCVCVCKTTFITPGTCVGLSDRKHSLIQVSGVWVKESSLSVYVHQHRCCQLTRQHVDSSAGPFSSDLSTHERKYDKQKGKCVASLPLRDVDLKDAA